MLVPARGFVLATLFFASMMASAQEAAPVAAAGGRAMRLNVVVAPRSGAPVTGLRQQDFTLLDNKTAATIKSFQEVTASQEPVKVILMIDAVNTGFSRVAYVREQVQKFLRANGGALAHPTTLAVLTDQGTQIDTTFTTDGNALSASLDHYTIGLREITRSSGVWGADERVQISLTAVSQLTAYAGKIPGRKIVLWVSPGWPLLSGVRSDLNAKQQQQIFGSVVAFSKQLQAANLTLYNINPLGPEEDLVREDFYQSFLKGVSKPSQTDLADLSLQVLAVQSGGLSINGSSDVAGSLKKCFADTESWYEITFDMAATDRPNGYHQVTVTVDKPGLTARTRDGYYAQP